MWPAPLRSCLAKRAVYPRRAKTRYGPDTMPPRPLLALLLAAACQAPQTSDTGFGSTPEPTAAATSDTTGTSTPPADTTTPEPGTSTTSTSSSDSTAGETIDSIFDLGTPQDLGNPSPAGCKGKIDLLFVVSREGVMAEVQDRLIGAFPQFIATIQDKFADFDYHIMVVDSGDTWGLETCNENCTPEGCSIPDYPCDKLELVTWCDDLLGAGTVFPAGSLASNKPCPVAPGRRFLTSDQPDLPDAFMCLAQVGVSGRGMMGDALAAAVSHQLTGPGGCNDDFLRDDALLLVALLGDHDKEGNPNASTGTPEQWSKAVLDAKHGDPNSVVMLSIGDPQCPWWGDRLCKLLDAFPYHHIGDILDHDYGPAFDKTTDLVEEACAGFVPPPG